MRKFLADAMLSKLERWLRMLGYSVESAGGKEDDEIIKEAIRAKKTILTKDEAMHYKATNYTKAVLLKGNCLDGQLLQFFEATKQNLERVEEKNVPNRSICSACNGKLEKIGKKEAGKKVPPKSLESATVFLQCSSCRQLFWNGTHNAKILKRFRKIRRLSGKRSAF